MARDYFIAGEVMCTVKGPAGSPIANTTLLGLGVDACRISIDEKYLDLKVDAMGGERGPAIDMQNMLGEATISVRFIHYDAGVLETCVQLAKGNPPAVGRFPHAGTRIGGGGAQFTAGNNFISLSLVCAAVPQGIPAWRFYYTYVFGNPIAWPIGAERSIVEVNWRALPYTPDPWNGGLGASAPSVILYDHTADT